MAEENPPSPVYANVFAVTVGPYDAVFDFGFRSPEVARRGSLEFETVSRVAMSLSHMKAMLPLMARQIADYEQRFGPITAPGFDESAKE